MNDSSSYAFMSHLSATQQAIVGLADRNTDEQLTEALEGITKLMRFDYYHYVGSFSVDDNACIQRALSNLPAAWRQQCAVTDSTPRDPIVQVARFRVTPVAWKKPQPEAPADRIDSYHVAHQHGIGNGVILPVHSKNGDAAALGFFIRADRDDDEQTIGSALGDAGLTAMYLHDSMSRIVAKAHHVPRAPLTPREIECLRWIANHKSNWAIAKILGISEHGAVYYVRRIMWKLDAQNRYQAVARATAYGLI